AAAINGKLSAYVGVPASMTIESADPARAAEFGRRIVKAFDGRVIVNIGDILPINGSIQTAIGIGAGLT
ncbi:MAG: hypothetical protein FWE62_02500, partial [Firmicutes bacterium]|nr:hypothetical protein [Bacillota bacterium]